MSDENATSENRIVDNEADMTPSPWYCSHCEVWVGRKLHSCLNGHSRPRLPLYYNDVDFDYSPRVRLRDRVSAKFRRLIGR